MSSIPSSLMTASAPKTRAPSKAAASRSSSPRSRRRREARHEFVRSAGISQRDLGDGKIALECAALNDQAGRRDRQVERGAGGVGAGGADAVLRRRPWDAGDEPSARWLIGEVQLRRLRRGFEMDKPVLQAKRPPVRIMAAGER